MGAVSTWTQETPLDHIARHLDRHVCLAATLMLPQACCRETVQQSNSISTCCCARAVVYKVVLVPAGGCCTHRKPSKKCTNGTDALSVARWETSAMSCASCTLCAHSIAQPVWRTAITSCIDTGAQPRECQSDLMYDKWQSNVASSAGSMLHVNCCSNHLQQLCQGSHHESDLG